MILETTVFVGLLLMFGLDCWSTALWLRHNHKVLVVKKYRRWVNQRLYKKVGEDETSVEMSWVGRHLIRRWGGDRSMVYVFVLDVSSTTSTTSAKCLS